jgi:hypothetical protein
MHLEKVDLRRRFFFKVLKRCVSGFLREREREQHSTLYVSVEVEGILLITTHEEDSKIGIELIMHTILAAITSHSRFLGA